MDRLAHGISDDELSLPNVQLSAITEALLAHPDLATAPQDSSSPPYDSINQRKGNAVRVRRSPRLERQHQRPSPVIHEASRPRSEDPVDNEPCWYTPSAASTGATSFHVAPRRLPRRLVVASAAEDSSTLEKQGISDNGPGVQGNPDIPSPPCAERRPADVEHSARTPSLDKHNLVPHASAQDTSQAETGGAGKQSVRIEESSTRTVKESAERMSGNLKRENAEQTPLHGYDMDKAAQNVSQPDVGRLSLVPLGEAGPMTGRQSGPVVSAPLTATPSVAVPPALKAVCSDRKAHSSNKRKTARRFVVNGHSYTFTRDLGSGGSGQVYEVLSEENEARAFKTIPLRNMDALSKKQLQNEVALLGGLGKKDRVVYLEDWAIDEARESLYIVMELGQCDLESILKDQIERDPKLDVLFVGYYWLEMLKCVALIHTLDIVHSDLKPANFVLVKGMLKLIDFGIANPLPDDTVNIYQDHLAGTPNYMAPETLMAPSTGRQMSSNRTVKFGKPSDMWSLGCIFYRMVYGQPPFRHIQDFGPKALAIINPDHTIEHATEGLGGVKVPRPFIRTMRACLSRDPLKRPTADDLLQSVDGLLAPPAPADNVVYVTSQTMEAIFSNAIRQAGAQASPEEIKSWAEQMMGNLTESS
ncbi:Serine/threonine-protein kinase MPS1 [Tolypocladium paradoxum]|uniref:Serine/threonine-protein kinase MPS1 n=1 Tax=Tolypocladium paradoxum TaxID=94208 RepID=A0A2S4L0E5_9HYPO|nr:Serine/threonine-protein kinase MPS1 [Tolypocladium paradoxum]